ncbi:hypothetical protein A1O7_09981 [Cladophialophora yegresii CBS 114405]|uniref:Uncharacterized protein n=1 Tax=Cladophialophora yegresii CBS 114405 TaxID=1182544 RepID=W9VNQ4_9EURO|nr:uncharacterized protein A1O7_09981 [Cladophialophora yegresii CBS 114405]EXJ54640.1 hypothetical protein A1O7_09981 [Cladophialophora yegresii CBS 114405]
MAATEYFAPGARPPLEQQSSGPYLPQTQRPSQPQPGFGYQPGHPSPQFGSNAPPSPYAPHAAPRPPPPYEPLNNEAKVHFAQESQLPPPGQQRPSLSSQPTYALNQPNYQANPGQHLAPYPPGRYVPQGPYLQQQPYAQSHHRPHHRGSYNDPSRLDYSSDPESHRHRHKNRPRRVSDNSRSTNADGFLGAAGGGLIGDLIFPGLGTVGGALVGWLGGKDYGKHRKWREEKRDREQDRWERKYNKGDSGSDRSRSHSRDNRDKDTQRSRHSHATRRKSYD